LDPTCCGNCRDILFDELGSGEIVTGPVNDIVSVANFEDIKFNGFRNLDEVPMELLRKVGILANHGRKLRMDAYSSGKRPERNYLVGIETEKEFHIGAHDIGADYHPIYAGRDAMRQARRAKDPFIKSIIVFADSKEKPYVMYKDRQHLSELNIDGEVLSGKENNPPVHLFTPTRAWTASLKETLPFPFVVTAFGDDFVNTYRNWAKEAYSA
jgi:hypothetical protein